MPDRGSAAEVSSLSEAVDRLARFESHDYPVLTLYLDARPDGRGRDHFQPFVRKELASKAAAFPERSRERESYENDADRIRRWLDESVRASANGVAIFACSGGGLFETFQLDAPLDNHFAVGSRPNLYLLARLVDENPRYAAVVADTRSARIFVFGRGREIDAQTVESEPTSRPTGGGSSQMRYQRHVDRLREEHAREVVETLERVVAEDRVDHVVLVGDEVIVPLLKSMLPKALAAKVVDSLHLDKKTASEADVFDATMRVIREWDARSDAEKVRQLMGDFLAGGLAVIGEADTRRALEAAQVDELLISASLPQTPEWAEELVRRAKQTAARVTFVEDPALLKPAGDVGAFLRYRIAPIARNFPGQEKPSGG
jgi:peptide subunit release factor 1 (eRF1)